MGAGRQPDVQLVLYNLVGATLGTSPGVGTIIDNEAAPTMTISSPTQSEGTTPMDFTVTLTGAADTAITVDYATADGTALAPEDYTAIGTTTLTIPAGSASPGRSRWPSSTTSSTRTTRPSPSSSPTRCLRASPWAAAGPARAPSRTTTPAPPSSIDSPTVDEAAGTMTFTLTLSGESQRAGTQVSVATSDGTATVAGLDYTACPLTVVPFASMQI